MGILSLRRDLEDLNRLRQITSILVKEGFHAYLAEAELAKHAKITTRLKHARKKKDPTPARARKALETLGPTFTKLGQILALRPDLVPDEYCTEFKKLQDDAKPIPFSVVKKIVEEELGTELKDAFKDFEKKPLAAASISQVHKATLKNGDSVVVKVQRPGVKKIVDQDIDIMEYIAAKLDHGKYKRFHAPDIVKEFKRYTENEFDFMYELKNTKIFYDFAVKEKLGVVPKTYPEFSTKKILTLGFIDGVPFTDKEALLKAKFNLRELVRLGNRGVCYQGFILGMFHADPHPGNLLAVRQGKKQTLALLDYGIVGYMSEDAQQSLLKFFDRLMKKDAKAVVHYLEKMGVGKTEETDEKGLMSDVNQLLARWDGTNLGEERMSNLFYKIVLAAIDRNLDLSVDIVTVAKTMVTVEGSGVWLDPTFNLAEEFPPLIKEVMERKFGPEKSAKELFNDLPEVEEFVRELPDAASTFVEKIKQGNVNVHIDGKELSTAFRDYNLEEQRRNIVLFAGMFFLGSAILAGLAPNITVLGYPLYVYGFGAFIITLFFFMRITRKIRRYRGGEEQQG